MCPWSRIPACDTPCSTHVHSRTQPKAPPCPPVSLTCLIGTPILYHLMTCVVLGLGQQLELPGLPFLKDEVTWYYTLLLHCLVMKIVAQIAFVSQWLHTVYIHLLWSWSNNISPKQMMKLKEEGLNLPLQTFSRYLRSHRQCFPFSSNCVTTFSP